MGLDVISLTFDDGYGSTFEHAAPILARYSMPATVGVICNPVLWGRSRGFMPLESLRGLAASGWEIASHSLFHRRMQKLPPTYRDETASGWRSYGSGLFAAACPWEDIGTIVEDSGYLRRYETMQALDKAEAGSFFHDVASGQVYVRPRRSADLDDRLKFGSMERELGESRAVLESLEFDVQSFIVPFSYWLHDWEEIGLRYYAFVLSVAGRVNLPGERAFLGRIRTRADTTVRTQIETIERHLQRGGWPILCFHQIRPEPQSPLDWSVTRLARLLKWISKSGLRVCTLAEGARLTGISSPAQQTAPYSDRSDHSA